MKGKAIAVVKSLVRTSLITVFAAGAVAGALVLPPSTSTTKLSRFPVSCFLTTPRSGGTRKSNSYLFHGKSMSTDKVENFDFPKKEDNSLVGPSPIIVPKKKDTGTKQQALDRGRAFVKSIMDNEYEPIPDSDGMSVLRNVIDLESTRPMNVVVRSITIPFWQKCIEKVDDPEMWYRVAALGTPGIGKSTTTSILIRMLLKQGKTVVYLVRTNNEAGWYYEFVPGPNNSIVTKAYPEKMINEDIPSLRLASTYHIVDPGETKDSCNPPRSFQPKVILVPPPDSGHWGGTEFTKARNEMAGVFKYLPVWSLAELLSAQPILRPAMTEDQVKKNFRSFGGVPRHVFGSKSTQAIAYLDQNSALNILNEEQVGSIARGEMDANDSFFPGTPKSALMGYCLPDNPDGEFESKKAILKSPLVEDKVYTKFTANLWGTMLSSGEDGWKIFEAYTRSLLTKKGRRQLQFRCRSCVGKSDLSYDISVNLKLGGCSEIRLGLNPVMEAKAEKKARVLFHSVKRKNKLFDFIYKDKDDHFHAFQVTVGNTHSANVTHIEELQLMVGGASKLSIYYLIPAENFVTFVTKPVNPRNDKNSNVSCNIWHVFIPNPKENTKLMMGNMATSKPKRKKGSNVHQQQLCFGVPVINGFESL